MFSKYLKLETGATIFVCTSSLFDRMRYAIYANDGLGLAIRKGGQLGTSLERCFYLKKRKYFIFSSCHFSRTRLFDASSTQCNPGYFLDLGSKLPPNSFPMFSLQPLTAQLSKQNVIMSRFVEFLFGLVPYIVHV